MRGWLISLIPFFLTLFSGFCSLDLFFLFIPTMLSLPPIPCYQVPTITPRIHWSPSCKSPHYFHLSCQEYFFRPISTELLNAMEVAHIAAVLTLSSQDFRFLRQIEIDMDDDLRWKIADLGECIAHVRGINE